MVVLHRFDLRRIVDQAPHSVPEVFVVADALEDGPSSLVRRESDGVEQILVCNSTERAVDEPEGPNVPPIERGADSIENLCREVGARHRHRHGYGSGSGILVHLGQQE